VRQQADHRAGTLANVVAGDTRAVPDGDEGLLLTKSQTSYIRLALDTVALRDEIMNHSKNGTMRSFNKEYITLIKIEAIRYIDGFSEIVTRIERRICSVNFRFVHGRWAWGC
jgi:hypothetical protein